jgi:hypothetical protein
MRDRIAFALIPGFVFVLGCGANTGSDANDVPPTAKVDSGSDGGTTTAKVDSGSEGGTTGPGDALACEPAFVQAGPGLAGNAEIPVYHRAEPACCPTARGPAPPGQPYGAGEAAGCTSDSQCTNGLDGRCLPFEGLVGPGGCSYDACLTDSDCPSGAACLCRSSATDSNASICVAKGNCVLDADCGAGGYCSPSDGCGGPVGYYCHTAADTCMNDVDCPSADAGANACERAASCAYDSQAKHWACTQLVCCPP